MPTLNNFFQPFTLKNILIFLILFIFLDGLGSFIVKKFISKNNYLESRPLYWMIGLGVFVFLWFLLSIFIPYNATNIIVSLVLISAFVMPNYFKTKEYLRLIDFLWSVRLGILIMIPFLPAVFVKASLPPYFGDEMAYHYIPPASLITLDKVKYVGGFYADLPRLLNTFWEIIFSLSKTYAIARLFHFTILASAMLYCFAVLRNYFNIIAAFTFAFVFFSLPQDVVITSTLGYIDVGAYSFILIAIVSFVVFVLSRKQEFLVLTAIFWGLNIGTKYTGLTAIAVFIFMGLILFMGVKRIPALLKYKSHISKLIFCLLLFGGYWYVKNFLYYGNPIFPFVFDCWGQHVEPCKQGGSYFGDWTTRVSLSNLPTIFNQLFVANPVIRVGILLSPLLLFFRKSKEVQKIAVLLFGSVVMEFVILKYFSGFYVRYHQHIQLYLLLGTVIVLTSKTKNNLEKLFQNGILALVLLSSLYFYISNIKHVNSLKFLNWTEIKYSISQIDIYEWVRINFPNSYEVIRWCDGGPEAQPVNLARFDPDLVWFTHDGLSRVFLIRCTYANPNIKTDVIEGIIPSAIENKQSFWITSINECIEDSKIAPHYSYEQPRMTYLRRVNNEIICHSVKVKPYLYYFDYNKVNN